MHYALVLIIAMGIGGFMPLAGVGFYVCCAIMRCDVERAFASDAAIPGRGALGAVAGDRNGLNGDDKNPGHGNRLSACEPLAPRVDFV
jgi:hypothetical protein